MARKAYHHMTKAQRCSTEILHFSAIMVTDGKGACAQLDDVGKEKKL
jgi:hypothetical protein